MTFELSHLPEALAAATEALTILVVCYPFVTSLLWSLSSIAYLARGRREVSPTSSSLPHYSIVVPFHAEPEAALASARSLISVYPPYQEIVLVDDGSPHPLSADAVLPPRTRVLRLETRGGKARALEAGAKQIEFRNRGLHGCRHRIRFVRLERDACPVQRSRARWHHWEDPGNSSPKATASPSGARLSNRHLPDQGRREPLGRPSHSVRRFRRF